jgi:hypothetical protein
VAGKFLKGAFVSFMPTFVGSLPNVVVFQYNPESITHSWSAAQPTAPKAGGDPLAVDHVPGETFTFKLSLDALDSIADGNSNPIAAGLANLTGVYTRLAALEMLQYPADAFAGSGLVGTVSASVGAAGVSLSAGGQAAKTKVPRAEVPTVLFIWGPQRIVPVRVSSLSITETLYDSLLNPTHADVSITLTVLTPEELASSSGELKEIAKGAYLYSQGLRQVQALANLGDAAASILGMLPSPF